MLNKLLRTALPIIISQGAFAINLFTARYFLSQIDAVHMAAALGAGVASYFTISLFAGALGYGNALVAQYHGAQEKEKCSLVLTQGILLCVFCWPILLVLTFFLVHVFEWVGHAEEQATLERTYYTITTGCAVLNLMKVCFESYFSGIGRANVMMFSQLLSIGLNIPITWILVFGKFGLPPLGIAGAAIATVGSTAISVAILLGFYLRPANVENFGVRKSLRFVESIASRYVRIGIPSGLQALSTVAAFNIFLLMFQSYGIPEAASAAIIFNFDNLSFVPMQGLNIAVTCLVGHYLAAGEREKVDQVISSSFRLGLGYSFMLAGILLIFRERLVDLFLLHDADSDQIRKLAEFMMLGLSSYVLAEGIYRVSAGILRGAGDTRWMMWCTMFCHWGALIVQLFIIKLFELNSRISWSLFVFTLLVIAAMFVHRVNSNRWRHTEKMQALMLEIRN